MQKPARNKGEMLKSNIIPHIPHISIETAPDQCENSDAGAGSAARIFSSLKKFANEKACGTLRRKLFLKTLGQPAENDVTHLNTIGCMSQNGLGQAWDKLGQIWDTPELTRVIATLPLLSRCVGPWDTGTRDVGPRTRDFGLTAHRYLTLTSLFDTLSVRFFAKIPISVGNYEYLFS